MWQYLIGDLLADITANQNGTKVFIWYGKNCSSWENGCCKVVISINIF